MIWKAYTFVTETSSKLALMKINPSHLHVLAKCRGLVLMLLAGVLTLGSLRAQGWERAYGSNKLDEGFAVSQAIDEGYVIAGYSEGFGEDNDLDVYVVRTDVDGTVIWQQVYDEGFSERGWDMVANQDGSLTIVGDIIENEGEASQVYLIKIDARGELLWSRKFGSETGARMVGRDLARTPDGGYILTGLTTETDDGEDDVLLLRTDSKGDELWRQSYGGADDQEGSGVVTFNEGFALIGSAATQNANGFGNDIIVYRTDEQGDTLWTRRISSDENNEGRGIAATRDEGLVITGLTGDNSEALLLKYDSQGTELWRQTFGGALGDSGEEVIELANGHLVVVGQSETSTSDIDVLLSEFDENGNQLWERTIGDPGDIEVGNDLAPTNEGGFIIGGSTADDFTTLLNSLLLVKTDNRGRTLTNSVNGRVVYDADAGCEGEIGGNDILPLKDWTVRISNADRTFYGSTDAEGNYRITVDTGTYQVEVIRPNATWRICQDSALVTFTEFYDSTTVDFPVNAAENCPLLQVDVAAPFLTPCDDVTYTVSYCNAGTVTAEDAFVEVELDSEFTYLASEIPLSEQNGNLLTFELADIPATDCGSFTIDLEMACEGIAQQQAGLVEAHIFPDSLCTEPNPEWNGSTIEVEGRCVDGETIEFQVRNTGVNPLEETVPAIIVQEDIVFRQVPIQQGLDPGETITLNPILADGQTYRIIADQPAFHPSNSRPTVAIEGCVEEGEPFSTGKLAMFPEDEGDPYIAIDVEEVDTTYGSNIPNATLRGYPKGYRDTIIAQETDITYKILFSNTGTDTISRVVIRDTLSPHLDITTVIPGASNFPYNYEVYDNGILKITFSDIELLPAGSAADKSFGYVTFTVAQKPNNPEGTVINNRAAVYFDYRRPRVTNNKLYVVGDYPSFILITDTESVLREGVKINVFPNPFRESAKFEIKGRSFNQLQFEVYDLSGRLIEQRQYSGNEFMYYRGQLSAGMYVYKLTSEGRLINSGKILVR